MRCWIYTAKRWGDTEEVRWSVQWWQPPPVDEHGESMLDQAPENWHEFKTEAAAMTAARKFANRPDNFWKSARVCKIHLERVEGDTYDWEEVGNPIEVEAQ